MKIILLLIISFVNSVAYGMLWPFITINIYMLGGSIPSIVFVQTIPYSAYILSRLWGSLSDYFGKRKIFIITGQVLSLIPLFMVSLTQRLDLLILLIFLSNFFSSISSPSFLAALGETGGGSAYGYSQLIGNIGWTFGALIIGFLHVMYGQMGVYLVAAIVLSISLMIFSLFYREESKPNKSKPLKFKIKESFSLKLKAKPGFKMFLLAMFLAWTGAYWNSELLKIKLFTLLGESVEKYSEVFGYGVGLLAIFASYIATKVIDKFGAEKPLTLSTCIYTIFSILLGILNDPALYVSLYIVPIWPIFWASQAAATYQFSEKGFEAENMGAFIVATSIAVLPAVMSGFIAEIFDLNISIALSALFFLATSIVLFLTFYMNKVEV
ncbi:MAG: hypothetical protein DRJ38_00870 [Thermoprotei archaeon]|nr:MAG: hypothetical protein DRJ38_00870 [Thermoprotei archaeon]